MNNIKFSIITIALFLALAQIIIVPIILPALGISGNTTYFNVTVTVTSGLPIITAVQSISDSPNEGTTKTVHFYFNATHPNGVANIPASNAHITINQSTTYIQDSGCVVNYTDGATLNRFDCNITINYNTLPGPWTINASITDSASNTVTNLSATYTNGNTYGVSLKTNSITFSGSPGQTRPANENPQYVNNTGNVGFNQINLTAFSLQSGPNIIGAGNFTANTTDGSGAGQMMINGTGVILTNSNISVGAIRNLYLYLNIPNGITNGTYNSSNAWIVTMS